MANHTANVGVHAAALIAEENGWFFREQAVNDVGIDAHIEQYNQKTGEQKNFIGIQIKSGESWFNNADEKVLTYYFDEAHYNYWNTNLLPCIIVFYNPITKLCVWQQLTSSTMKKTNGGKGNRYCVKVPLSQIFIDEQSNQSLLEYSNRYARNDNYSFLKSHKDFMQVIANGGSVQLKSREWINKSSGRGEISLIVDIEDKTEEYIMPYWFPFTPYKDVFVRLFPWANFSANKDFYYDDDYSNWLQNHCHYDSEDDKYYEYGISFEEYVNELPTFRYICHAGEVGEYLLDMTLNELGEAFLMVDNFITSKIPYTDTRPKKQR